MHPLERLRYVARVQGADPALLAVEMAESLAEIAGEDPAGLVPACRRLVDRHPSNGPVWWLSARLLSSPDPADAASEAAGALTHDPTAGRLAAALPDDAVVAAVGWPDVVGEALRRRGDLEVLLVDGGGESAGLLHSLEAAGAAVCPVPDWGVAAAASVAGVVLVEASLAGPGGLLAAPGSYAAAAVAARAGVAVWAVAGVGRVLPGALWDAALARLDADGREPWDRDVEVVPAELFEQVVTPEGLHGPEAFQEPGCPVAPELLRRTAGAG